MRRIAPGLVLALLVVGACARSGDPLFKKVPDAKADAPLSLTPDASVDAAK